MTRTPSSRANAIDNRDALSAPHDGGCAGRLPHAHLLEERVQLVLKEVEADLVRQQRVVLCAATRGPQSAATRVRKKRPGSAVEAAQLCSCMSIEFSLYLPVQLSSMRHLSAPRELKATHPSIHPSTSSSDPMTVYPCAPQPKAQL
jgi:hypothetical protein